MVIGFIIYPDRSAYQRWAESEKLTPKPDPVPKTKNPHPAPKPVSLQIFDSESGYSSVPISAMLLFYIHSIYIIPYILNPDPAQHPVFPKNSHLEAKDVAGLRIRAQLCAIPPLYRNNTVPSFGGEFSI